MKSRSVRVWAIKTNTGTAPGKAKRSYTVRWVVAGHEKSRTFATRALADNFRSDLMQAISRGEAFETGSGLPDTMAEAQQAVTWLEFVVKYVDMKWPGAAAKSRDSMVDALATVTPVLIHSNGERPDVNLMRRALRDHVLPPSVRPVDVPADLATALRSLRRTSVPLPDLAEPVTVRAALDALALKLDGTPAAATTYRRKRSVFYNVLQYAVELELLEYNPVDKLKAGTRRRKIAELVDRRVVASPRQVRELLTAVTYVGSRGVAKRGERLVAFYGCLYFAALRPGEALGLRERDCVLPDSGWDG